MLAAAMRYACSHRTKSIATLLALRSDTAHDIARQLAIGATMDTSAPRIDCTGATPPIGYHRFHPDVSINFQCNRWVQWIGPSALDDGTELASRANTYPELID